MSIDLGADLGSGCVQKKNGGLERPPWRENPGDVQGLLVAVPAVILAGTLAAALLFLAGALTAAALVTGFPGWALAAFAIGAALFARAAGHMIVGGAGESFLSPPKHLSYSG